MKIKSLLLASIFVLVNIFTVSAFAIEATSIVGQWWNSDKDAKIEIYQEQDTFFGKIVWVQPKDEQKLDDKNPKENLRSQKIMGLVILKDFKFDKDQWADGTIYDPKSGKTYSCKMSLDTSDNNKLKIRGFIGVSLFGRNEIFTRHLSEN